jgi:hypothetical protein
MSVQQAGLVEWVLAGVGLVLGRQSQMEDLHS